MFNISFKILVYELIETLMNIFEKQFHVLKLCFDMFITSLIYNLRFYNLGNYKKVNVLYNNSFKSILTVENKRIT